MWLVAHHAMPAYELQQKLWTLQKSPWVGQQYRIAGPMNAHIRKAHHSYHTAYLKTNAGDSVTCLSPPIWVDLHETPLAGEWCMLGTHYTTDTAV